MLMMDRGLYGKLDRIMKSRNIFVMVCKSGRHWSISNAELWSRTLARFVASLTRVQHFIFVSMTIGDTLAKAHAQNVQVTELSFLRKVTSGSSTSANDLVRLPRFTKRNLQLQKTSSKQVDHSEVRDRTAYCDSESNETIVER